MYRAQKLRTLVILTIILNLASAQIGIAKSDKKKSLPPGTPVLWRAPNDISKRDLYLGPGGPSMRPDLRKLTLLKEEKGGYSRKYRVKDASGHEWVAKVGKEAQPETAAVRLLWGLGYQTEINYLVPQVTIPGKGTFKNVRFEARPDAIKRLDQWKWKTNPFIGTPEFQGLKIMMALMNNWDLKDANNQILLAHNGRGNELHYIISDLGATFGHASTFPLFWRIMRSRNNPDKYSQTKFLEKVNNNRVKLHYGGKNRGLFDNISVRDAQWLASWLSQLSDRQIGDAFRAANYSPADVNLLLSVVRQRTEELQSLRAMQPVSKAR